jgi:hypothetical protein
MLSPSENPPFLDLGRQELGGGRSWPDAISARLDERLRARAKRKPECGGEEKPGPFEKKQAIASDSGK